MKNYFEESRVPEVDWMAFELAATSVLTNQRQWLTKHFAHSSTTSKVMHTRGECGMTQNAQYAARKLKILTTYWHVYGQPDGRNLFTRGWKTGEMVEYYNRDANPYGLIMKFLHLVREKQAFQYNPLWDKDICALVLSQLCLGQRAMVHGFLSNNDWSVWHSKYLKEMVNVDSPWLPPPKTWVQKLITHLWNINFVMWYCRCEIAHGTEENRIITLSNGENIDDKLHKQWAAIYLTISISTSSKNRNDYKFCTEFFNFNSQQ